MPITNIKGERYGRLLVKKFSHIDKTARWKCKCDCGKVVIRDGAGLRAGYINSCGCLRVENTRKMKTTHGARSNLLDKGQERLYSLWCAVKDRTGNPNNESYERYGGRGIKLYKKWIKDYVSFKLYMENLEGYNANLTGKQITIERIDNNEGYKPGNIRWASPKEQGANKRNNIIVKYKNKNIKLIILAAKLGIANYNRLYERITVFNWPIKKAIKDCE